MSKQRAKTCHWASKILGSYLYNENSSVIAVCFATFEFEHNILILLRKSDVWSCKVEIFEWEICFLDGGVG